MKSLQMSCWVFLRLKEGFYFNVSGENCDLLEQWHLCKENK